MEPTELTEPTGLTELAEPAVPTPSVPAPGRTRLVVAVTAAVVVALAAIGGAGYAVLRQVHDDRSGADAGGPAGPSASPSPTASGTFGSRPGGTHYGRLSSLLLPVPLLYTPGPDIAEYGNDTELSGSRAAALFKSSYSHLPRKQRRSADAAIDLFHIEGLGMRSYAQDNMNGADPEGAAAIDIQLVQMKNQDAVREAVRFFSGFAKDKELFRPGPKITGYDQARCVIPKRLPGERLDTALCQAAEGDLLVTVNASGTGPLLKAAVADLLKRQLDRVKARGEAV